MRDDSLRFQDIRNAIARIIRRQQKGERKKYLV